MAKAALEKPSTGNLVSEPQAGDKDSLKDLYDKQKLAWEASGIKGIIKLDSDNIGRQFEFIQHTWTNNPKFAELSSLPNYRVRLTPLLGENNPKSIEQGIYGNFTALGDPLCKRVHGLTRFLNVKGGTYFFMPGTIKHLNT